MLLIDPDAALAAIPSMLPPDAKSRADALDLITQVMAARGEMSPEGRERLVVIGQLFTSDDRKPAERTPLRPVKGEPQPDRSTQPLIRTRDVRR
jgi:hypothetical protein